MNIIVCIVFIILILFLFKIFVEKYRYVYKNNNKYQIKENFELLNKNVNNNTKNNYILSDQNYIDTFLINKFKKEFNIKHRKALSYNDIYNNSNYLTHPLTNYAIKNQIIQSKIQNIYNNLVNKCNQKNKKYLSGVH